MNKVITKVKVEKRLNPTKILKEHFPEAYALMVKHKVFTRWKVAFMTNNISSYYDIPLHRDTLTSSFKTWREDKRIDILIGGYFAWNEAKPLLEGTKFKDWGEVQRSLMKGLTGDEFYKEENHDTQGSTNAS